MATLLGTATSTVDRRQTAAQPPYDEILQQMRHLYSTLHSLTPSWITCPMEELTTDCLCWEAALYCRPSDCRFILEI